ncbi:MAG: Gfo/Idh/MocA family oxidoreductase [Spirochaetes bacterium]|jgi:predicted dehydrogenase|nr:Gfo/Idh/MocA family oxidoreductase [Spirochaetota bacterium]
MRLGFIGAGFISTFHATALTMVRNVEVTAVLRRSRSPQFVEHCSSVGVGTPREYDSIAEVVRNCDVVAIYNPNFSRIETMKEIVAAVEAGATITGVVIEKPLGRTMKEARTLVDLAKRANLKTAYFENQIFMKAIAAQRDQLKPSIDAMGPPSLVRSAEEHGGPHANWFWDPVQLGGGVLMDMGCHSIAVGQHLLTPPGKPLSFLEPVAVSCDTSLLKWGESPWREQLLKERGIDYGKTPAEDFATGIITYRNPETGAIVKSQFTDSWMFEKQGLRLMMDGMGPGYAFEVNTLRSPTEIFIGDAAAESLADAELALEKSTATRGLLPVQANEADLYGYVDENRDMVERFSRGEDAMLNWEYGLEITRLLMAAYYSGEQGKVIDLTDPQIDEVLENYVPAIQKGEGNSVLKRGAKK